MTNQRLEEELASLVATATSLEFGNVGTFEYFPEHQVLGLDKRFLYPVYASMQGACDTVGQSLLALLCTTENLKAINARKRQVKNGLIDPKDELHILDLLLSSFSPKHNKSPMLWQHRRWLLQLFPSLFDLNTELSVLAKSGDRHPLNYYAFAYARWLVSILPGFKEREQVCDWCWSLCYYHISDTSMWSFLAFVDINGKYRAQATELNAKYNRPAINGYLMKVNI